MEMAPKEIVGIKYQIMIDDVIERNIANASTNNST